MPKVRLLFPLIALPVLAVSTSASSHREAPFVTENPKVDATDFYMFNAYEPGQEDNVVFIANYLPLQDAYGGPNYFKMDPEARYEIHVDNDGDALEDMTFRFAFGSRLKDLKLPVGPPGQEINVSVPLRTIGPINATNSAALNDPEEFGVWLVTGDSNNPTGTRRISESGTGNQKFAKPLDNVGTKTIADYAAYADSFVYNIDLPGGFTGRMFVGQRKESFVVNLGETFDLINLNPLGAPDAETNDLEDKNVTSFILELPKSFLVPQGGNPSIGGWTTAKLPRNRALSDNPTFDKPAETGGDYVQVSRLGMPLVNEVVIGLPDKNRFNASRPVDDAQFLDYVTNPTLPEIIEILFGVSAPDQFPRFDLDFAFLRGFPGLNETGGVGEMLRLNTATTAPPAALQDRLGVLGGDLAGFPNGRRPGDDVVDITLRVAMGAVLDPNLFPDGQLPYTDGAIVDATYFDSSFPYLLDPIPGAPQ